MTNQERLEKLELAEKLIREVEFSYEANCYERWAIYNVVSETFSGFGPLGRLVSVLKELTKQERSAQMDKENEALEKLNSPVVVKGEYDFNDPELNKRFEKLVKGIP